MLTFALKRKVGLCFAVALVFGLENSLSATNTSPFVFTPLGTAS